MDDLELRSIRCCEQNELALMLIRRFETKATRCKSYYPTSLKYSVDLLMKDLATGSRLAYNQAVISEEDLEGTTSTLLETHDLTASLDRVRLTAPSGSSDRFGLRWDTTDDCSSASTLPSDTRAMDLLVSFLQSMLNGNDSLAAAKSMMLSAQDVLVALRRRALKTGMSFGQTAESFVLRTRMGGCGHIDPTADELTPHMVSLVAYTDTIHLIRRLIEDATSEFTSCIEKVLRILCKQIVAHWSGSPALQCSLHKARDIMLAEVEIVQSNLSVIDAVFGSSPQRDVSRGGSMAGRPLMKLLQSLVDRWTIMLHRQSVSTTDGSPSQSLGCLSLSDMLSSPKITKENDGVSDVQSAAMDDRTPQRVLGERNRNYRTASFLNDDTPTEKSQLVQTEAMCNMQLCEDKENWPPADLPEQTPKRSKKRPAADATTEAKQAKKKRPCKQSINQPKISNFFFKT